MFGNVLAAISATVLTTSAKREGEQIDDVMMANEETRGVFDWMAKKKKHLIRRCSDEWKLS